MSEKFINDGERFIELIQVSKELTVKVFKTIEEFFNEKKYDQAEFNSIICMMLSSHLYANVKSLDEKDRMDFLDDFINITKSLSTEVDKIFDEENNLKK